MKTPLSRSQRLVALPLGAMCGMFGDRMLATQCIASAMTGHWEGVQVNRYRNRPSVKLQSQDSGLDFGVRDAYISEARALSQTYSLVDAITRKYANHVVGDCRLTWTTSDPKIDAQYAANWEGWMNICDADGKWRFPKLTKIAVETCLRECDSFGQFIGGYDQSGGLPSGSARIRLVEPDRVRNSPSMMDIDTDSVIGGVVHDAAMNRLSYRIWKRNRWGNMFENPVDVPAANVFHMFDSTRGDARRGITAFRAVIDHMRDEKEIVAAEKLSVKRNSKLALLVKNILGSADTAAWDLFNGSGDGTTGSKINTSESSGKINFQSVNDATDAYMFPNEEMKAHESNRPSEGWFELMRWMVHHTAIGMHLPFGVVWTMAGLSGPAVRFDLGQANRTFRAFREDIVESQWLLPIARRVTARDIARGALPYHPQWYSCIPRKPASITIDLGRDGKVGMDEVNMGLYSPLDYVSEDGRDALEVLADKGKWLKRADEIARELEIPVERLINLTQTQAMILQNEKRTGQD